MKAISIHQPWASWIARGLKTIETRSWPTNYRGDLLIASTKKYPGVGELCYGGSGNALCVVTLADCRPMDWFDMRGAICPTYPGAWAWLLENIRPIPPFPVRGRQRLYNVDPVPGVCRVCGCTDLCACAGGCFWVESDLCSTCALT